MTNSGADSSLKYAGKLPRRTFLGAFACLFGFPARSQHIDDKPPALDVPYVPTPQDVVDQMLSLAKPGPDDFVMDLGCGDGRMLVTAAQRFGARGFGVDLNPLRIVEANENARRANVSGKVRFEVRNLFETPIRDASILTMYLLPHINLQLRPRILADMKPGSRVVSHSFSMGDWQPDAQAKVRSHTIHFWIVPARVQGRWVFRDKGKEYRMTLVQQFQKISGGILSVEGLEAKVTGTLSGDRIALETVLDGAPHRLTGLIAENAMRGPAGESWSAVRE